MFREGFWSTTVTFWRHKHYMWSVPKPHVVQGPTGFSLLYNHISLLRVSFCFFNFKQKIC